MRVFIWIAVGSTIALAATAQTVPMSKVSVATDKLVVAPDALIAALDKRVDRLETTVATLKAENETLRVGKADKAQVDDLRNDFDHHWHIFQNGEFAVYSATNVPAVYCHPNGKNPPSCSKTMSGVAK